MNGSAPILLSAMVLSGLCGCGAVFPRGSPPMIPEPATARAALELAMHGWIARGDRKGDLDGTRVELTDRRNVEGEVPEGFTVLGTVRVDWGRGFVVRLDWGDQAEPQTVTYVVAGDDPIWVMCKEDIELLMHWEHPMDAPPTEPDASASAESGSAALAGREEGS